MPKRLISRLKSLESSSGQHQEFNRDDKKLLVTLLARRDALLWPWRFQRDRASEYGEILARQREYLSGELGLRVKAWGRSDWKVASDRRQRLIDAGLLTATHSGGQVQSVFLTAKGEAAARGLVGWLGTFEESVDVLQRLLVLAEYRPNRPIRESLLWEHPCTGNPSSWNHLTECTLPLLTAGVIRATSDAAGRIVYSIVDGATIPEPVSTDQQAESWASDAYIAAFNRERMTLDSVETRNGLDVSIPIPATGW